MAAVSPNTWQSMRSIARTCCSARSGRKLWKKADGQARCAPSPRTAATLYARLSKYGWAPSIAQHAGGAPVRCPYRRKLANHSQSQLRVMIDLADDRLTVDAAGTL